ncbi:hypothetical protein PPACK8108_LOCUS13575 [Phakopsora pachyrhizi]|uniref:RNA polymerase Rpb2 domain-containing protein n=1 Tax=Phakopsora pachyrhizi TaxID=170000 RepID=A0AAV0B7B7_PHAPC|nr:hypothetical protein PPACK8108_LOCUS13575 [Phakopsora pachyrhizi]
MYKSQPAKPAEHSIISSNTKDGAAPTGTSFKMAQGPYLMLLPLTRGGKQGTPMGAALLINIWSLAMMTTNVSIPRNKPWIKPESLSRSSRKQSLSEEALEVLLTIDLAHIPADNMNLYPKALYLAIMVQRVYKTMANPKLVDDRDYVGNKYNAQEIRFNLSLEGPEGMPQWYRLKFKLKRSGMIDLMKLMIRIKTLLTQTDQTPTQTDDRNHNQTDYRTRYLQPDQSEPS